MKTVLSRTLPKHVMCISWVVFFSGCLFAMSACQNGDRNSVEYSEDLSSQIQWLPVEVFHPEESRLRFIDIEWDGSMFLLIVEGHGGLMKSADGVRWTPVEHNLITSLDTITHGGGVYLATSVGELYRGTGIECWKRVKLNWRVRDNFIWTGERFLAASRDTVYQSDDGLEWKPLPGEQFDKIRELSWIGNGIVVATDKGHWFSEKGEKWSLILQGSNIANPIFWEGKLYGVGATNPFLFVERDQEWKLVLKPKYEGFTGVTEGYFAADKLLFAFGKHISWSSDGESWGSMPLDEDYFGWLHALVGGDGRYVAIGDSGMMMAGVERQKFAELQKAVDENNEAIKKLKETKKALPENATLKQRIDFDNFPKGFFQEKPGSDSAAPGAASDTAQSMDKAAVKKIEDLPVDEALIQILASLEVENDRVGSILEEKRKEYPDGSKETLIRLVLEETGDLFWTDMEAGVYPVGYDWLVSEFSQLAERQNIAIDKISMELEKGPCEGREQYRVRWSLKGTGYGIDFYDDSDWYSPLVIQALNTSLFLQGYRQRFVSLETGDQTAHFILADPDIVEALGL